MNIEDAIANLRSSGYNIEEIEKNSLWSITDPATGETDAHTAAQLMQLSIAVAGGEDQYEGATGTPEADAAAGAGAGAGNTLGEEPDWWRLTGQPWDSMTTLDEYGDPVFNSQEYREWYKLLGQPKSGGEKWLRKVDDNGQSYDVYGTVDVDGNEEITRRTALPGGDLNIDQRISRLLSQVEDIGNPNDKNLQRAQAFFDFKNQPTKADRLQVALQIAQSPSDYMTLVGLYTGALKMEDPVGYGERIAPLAPFLQGIARQFFLDVPGITKPIEPPDTDALDGQKALTDGEPDDYSVMMEGTGLVDRVAEEDVADTTKAIVPSIPGMSVGLEEDAGGEGWSGEYELNGNGTTPESLAEKMRKTDGETRNGEYEPLFPSWASFAGPGKHEFPSPYRALGPPRDWYSDPFAPTGDIPPDKTMGATSGYWQGKNPADTVDPTRYVRPNTGGIGYWQNKKIALDPGGYASETFNFEPTLFEPNSRWEKRKRYQAYGKNKIPDFQQGGVIPGVPGDKKLITAEAGEVILPNDPTVRNQMLQKTGMFGPVFRPPPREEITSLTQPMLGSMPRRGMSQLGFRFRSPQTMRGMTPSQRAMYQAEIEKLGFPYSDYSAIEQQAAGLSGRRMPSLRFRSTGRMRG